MAPKGLVCCVIVIALTVLAATTSSAQRYPNKPVRIVTTAAGNSTDYLTRLIAQSLTLSWDQQVIVDNRGIIAGQIAAKAPPDGYTLISYGSPLWLAPFMQDHTPYDPVNDFAPITLTNRAPNILVIHPSLAVRSVQDLIRWAKANPGQLNYGSGSSGSSAHLAAELFKAMAGVDIVRIPYKGTGPALNDLMANQVQLIFASVGSIVSHVKSGRLRALAITSRKPSPLFPSLPTVAESGVPGYESVSPFGILAPARTSRALIERLNNDIVTVLASPEMREKFFNAGNEPVGSTPEEFGATIKAEMTRLGKLIRQVGIRN